MNSSEPFNPICPGVTIGHVHLKVADLERALAFYCGVLGFELMQRFETQAAFISAGGYHHHIGLNTWESGGGVPPPRRATGLYHLAILYPTRAALADALRRVVAAGIELDGAADHGVSEAVYLRDPDGNGVELYRDRPTEQWPRTPDGGLAMFTRSLDLADLISETTTGNPAAMNQISLPHVGPVDLAKAPLTPVQVFVSRATDAGRSVVRVTKNPAVAAVDEATFAKLVGTNFRNGIIEVEVLARLLKEAPDFARGFIGVAFRINEDNSRFESFYVRPTNARADDQLRRNHATQYFSFPDFKFDRLRKEAPGQYESYADMALGEWITLRIEVCDATAKLYLNGGKHPVLVVNDLKHGGNSSGAVGLWVDVGTEGYFSNLRVYQQS